MTTEGRLARGEENFKAGKFLNNPETLEYLDNKPEEVLEDKPKKEKKDAKPKSG